MGTIQDIQMPTLLFNLLKSMSVIVTFAYILSRIKSVVYNLDGKFGKKQKIFLTIFFIALSITGNFLGVIIMDAYANIRGIGAFMAGMMGGPVVGIITGVVSGSYRYSLGGFTAFACAVGTTSTAIIGSLCHKKYLSGKINFKTGFLYGIIALVIEMVYVVLLSTPHLKAFELVKIIGIPMIMSNSLGIALFISIIEKVKDDLQKIRAIQSEKILNIADKTLPLLQDGLTEKSALPIIEMIKEESGVDAVAITDTEKILSFTGIGSDHHLTLEPLKTAASKKAIIEGKTIILNNKVEISCSFKDCRLSKGVVTPLKIDDTTYGLLKLYRCSKNITVFDIKLAEGISKLLATQIKLSNLAKQAELKTTAELKALQAQINPHFLFNSLNTISALCRKDPLLARNLLVKLAGIFRKTLHNDTTKVTLRDEIQLCKDYLAIEKARFGDRLKVEWIIPEKLMDNVIPPFIIQPLIENSLKHGIFPKKDGGKITISANLLGNKVLELKVEDNGIGIDEDNIKYIFDNINNSNCIGIKNIKRRLETIYGNSAEFYIDKGKVSGTKNIIRIPTHFVFERENVN